MQVWVPHSQVDVIREPIIDLAKVFFTQELQQLKQPAEKWVALADLAVTLTLVVVAGIDFEQQCEQPEN